MTHLLYSSHIKDPKGIKFEGEDKGEKVISVLRRHFITNLRWIFFSVLLFMLPFILSAVLEFDGISFFELLPSSYNFVLLTFWIIFAFGYLYTSFLRWYFTAYIISDKRLIDIDFETLTHRRFSEALLSNVEDLTHQISGAFQVIFNYGTVHVQTAGEMREIDFDDVPDPSHVQDVISDLSTLAHARRSRHAPPGDD